MKNRKAGDVVVLKSGGPKMTISSIYNSNTGPGTDTTRVKCCWFEPTQTHLMRDDFAIEQLKGSK